MNPDGLSYLDLASAALNGGPAKLVNAYWSPGYPALISIALFLFRPSSIQEFPLIHFVNFLLFIFALLAFSIFLRYWSETIRADEVENENNTSYVTPFAFSTFLVFTLKYIGVERTSPDLGVAAIVFVAAGISCRLSLRVSNWRHYVGLGLVLAAGYYLKAAMLPLGLAFLVILFFLLPLSDNAIRRNLFLSLSVFVLVSAPLLAVLSVRAHRLTFGETGRLNYVWKVNGLEWTGGTGSPGEHEFNTTSEHPALKSLTKPLTLEFASRAEGTYPLWYDPSIWYAGAKAKFDVRQQLAALMETLRAYKDIALEAMPFISGAIVLFLLNFHERRYLAVPRTLWWQLAWVLATCSMYALVTVESRYVAPFLVLFWLVIYHVLTSRVNRRVTVAVCATVLLSVMVPLASNLAKTGGSIASDLVHPGQPAYQIAALGLRALGLQNGDRVAIVGYAHNCYYARYDRLHVAAQIPNAHEFWSLSAPELKTLVDRLTLIGVKAVIASNRPDCTALGGWKDVEVSNSKRLSVLLLQPNAAPTR